MVYQLEDLLYLMTRLRDPQSGCPWDLQQTFTSITSSSIEEMYELVDAIFVNDKQHIKEELGDVLFQVVFYAQLAKEQQEFDFAQVVDAITKKLVYRHPHVFPNGDLYAYHDTAIDVKKVQGQWEALKQQERLSKQQYGLLDDVPKALPALSRAQKLQKRAASVNFDMPDVAAVLAKIKEEISELEEAIAKQCIANIESEMGDVLFSCVNLARRLHLDAEAALSSSNRKFEKRIAYIELQLQQHNLRWQDCDIHQLDEFWNAAKTLEVQ